MCIHMYTETYVGSGLLQIAELDDQEPRGAASPGEAGGEVSQILGDFPGFGATSWFGVYGCECVYCNYIYIYILYIMNRHKLYIRIMSIHTCAHM